MALPSLPTPPPPAQHQVALGLLADGSIVIQGEAQLVCLAPELVISLLPRLADLARRGLQLQADRLNFPDPGGLLN